MSDEYEKRERQKDYVLEVIKELFEDGRIELEIDTYDEWESTYASASVKVDKKEVYKSSTYIGSSGWSDY